MKRAFIVIGPESSGTRLVTRLFVSAGCAGNDSHNQSLDRFVSGHLPLGKFAKASKTDLVFRRSIPHAGKYPDLGRIVQRFKEAERVVFVVVVLREWHSLAKSALARGHVSNVKVADSRIRSQVTHIFKYLIDNETEYTIVDSSLLFMRPDRALRWLENKTKLKFDKKIIKDADGKYYRKT